LKLRIHTFYTSALGAVSGQFHSLAADKVLPGPICRKLDAAVEPVWSWRRRDSSYACTRISTSIIQPIACHFFDLAVTGIFLVVQQLFSYLGIMNFEIGVS